MAGALLVRQCLDVEEAGGEVAVHAPQSGETRIGGVAGVMAVEQLPGLRVGGRRRGAGQRLGDSQDEDSSIGSVKPRVPAVVVPTSRKARDVGHPLTDLTPLGITI